jgi:hypothetical protein
MVKFAAVMGEQRHVTVPIVPIVQRTDVIIARETPVFSRGKALAGAYLSGPSDAHFDTSAPADKSPQAIFFSPKSISDARKPI